MVKLKRITQQLDSVFLSTIPLLQGLEINLHISHVCMYVYVCILVCIHMCFPLTLIYKLFHVHFQNVQNFLSF